MQADDDGYQEQLIQQMKTIKVEVEEAMSALKLSVDGFQAEDDLADPDCEY